ncbi:GIY-YIG nuclease family protein [Nocardioides sp. W7]|uniref:GIY-YIG nuclease family protein n=1 Tax=Nocardioides sp. W7 TaxID=2931390 RepID=UPI001FD35FFE|nr:GIY-YIG nuclease family protein [Nocardioides sp. W7]
MAWTYILECADGSLYVGSTTDLERRLTEHSSGEGGAAYTRPRRRRPVRLVWSVEVQRIDSAFALEKQIQGWGRAKRLALIDGRLDQLPDLARGRDRGPQG